MFGGIWPVVQRELRASARGRLNFWLRIGGALGGFLILCSHAWAAPDVNGPALFMGIHGFLLALIFCVVPAITADCIARERREGTLGLLFLTPLTASGIVVGKVLAQVLRALTFWLAVVPVLTIPFLSGGITRADVIACLVAELCAGMVCLAAGILASSLTERRGLAFILAFLFTGAFVTISQQHQDWYVGVTTSFRPSLAGVPPAIMVYPNTFRSGASRRVIYVAGATGLARSTFRYPLPSTLAVDFSVTALSLWAAIRFAGYCVERSWQDKVPSIRRQNLARRYCTPIFHRWFARRMTRTLEWNPIAWLQEYSWRARASKWGLCLLVVVVECALIDGNNPYQIPQSTTALLLVLAAAYTFAGVNGFLNDKRSGALELILVTPLSIRQIIFGRVWGLWKQFLPATAIVVGCDVAANQLFPRNFYDEGLFSGWFLIKNLGILTVFLTLPILATAAALRVKNLFAASALTWAALLLPLAVAFVIFLPIDHWMDAMFGLGQTFYWTGRREDPTDIICAIVAGNGFSVWLALRLLRRGLGRREYAV